MDFAQRELKSQKAVNLGLVSNIFLSILKTTAGVFGHSSALLADGINSTSDVAYYIVVKIFMGLSGKPADHEHPYGHRQFESIAALAVGSFVITTAIAVFWNSTNNAYDLFLGKTSYEGASAYAFWIAVFTIGLKIILAVITVGISKKTGNLAVKALAYDHRNDIFASAAAAAGIYMGMAGYPWVDPLAGALVAIVILRTGIVILKGSSVELMDTVPGVELTHEITGLVSGIKEVKKVDEIYAHRFGPYFVINLTICIDGSLSVKTGDTIATKVENTIYGSMDYIQKVHVHYHPANN